MAEVTINKKYYNVIGSRRQNLYNIDGDTGKTLTTGLQQIQQVNIQPVATNPPTASVSGGVITFASSGAFTGVPVEVIGT
jgi:hypothetical protein